MKWHYIVLLALAAGLLIWLTWGVLPRKAVMTLSPVAEGNMPHGAVFGYVSSSSKKGTTKIIRTKELQSVLQYDTGWSAVAAWMPFAFVVAIAGMIAGWVLGWWFRGNDAELAAENRIKALKDDIELSKTTMAEARKLERGVSEAHERAVKWVERIEKESAAKIAAAEADTAAELGLRLEAERKLVTERAKHEEELKKAGGRIAELKAKTKKNKGID